MYTPVNPSFTIQKWGLRGSNLYRHVFVMTSQRVMKAARSTPKTSSCRWSFVSVTYVNKHVCAYTHAHAWMNTRPCLLACMFRYTNGLAHCILNRHSHTIYWNSPISILGSSGYEIYIFLEKMAKLFANSGDPDQTPRSAASDLGQHRLSITLLRVSRL